MNRLNFAASIAIAAAALTISVTPAAAVDRYGMSQAASAAGVTVHRNHGSSGGFSKPVEFRRDGDRRRDRGYGDVAWIDREYQGDTAWRPESFNDWWHDNPSRNEPRWLRSNNCERQYWTGGGWRC